ncbi:hypothetical protein FTUN_6374 [Frigoriglobus tundricola]|uniref:Uncharacterized protein n=1 Tax=Frigoriglobus tundricola TaxID=2774151 RepID=A0A6M5YXP8_9BACT|nr:hypothetical protein FTUN_6374 [Frigoriglobus tundricola]
MSTGRGPEDNASCPATAPGPPGAPSSTRSDVREGPDVGSYRTQRVREPPARRVRVRAGNPGKVGRFHSSRPLSDLSAPNYRVISVSCCFRPYIRPIVI